MSDILAELSETKQAIDELNETIKAIDDKILSKKTELEKKQRENQKELALKNDSLNELKKTSNVIVANIDDIVAKLSKVLE
ncbi:MAG: hypothetical protein LBL47_00895 [Lactobacillus sp.]|jgi:FMN-dependent NADH-azoreductase|nr:hypothetical protein [Lactobacillus sp.]